MLLTESHFPSQRISIYFNILPIKNPPHSTPQKHTKTLFTMNMLGLRDLVFIAQTPSSLQHHHQQSIDHHANNNNNNNNNLPLPSPASLSVGLGIFPLLTATPSPCMPHPQECSGNGNNTTNSNNLWNLKMCKPQPQVDSTTKRVVMNMMNVEEVGNSSKNLMMGGCDEENGGVYGIGDGGEFRVCQDCGNRAKKDCSYKRCRTCCKGRGFDCSTHVKSTWVRASLRRDRSGGDGGGGDSDGGGTYSGTKRPRVLVSSTSHSSTSNANNTTRRSFSLDTTSCHQDAGFKQSLPRQVRAPAVFRCHRVSAIGNGEDEFAYLATVHISGHVFKGFLYDQGGGVVDRKNEMPCVSELQLGSNGSGRNKECSSAVGVPTSACPASTC